MMCIHTDVYMLSLCNNLCKYYGKQQVRRGCILCCIAAVMKYVLKEHSYFHTVVFHKTGPLESLKIWGCQVVKDRIDFSNQGNC